MEVITNKCFLDKKWKTLLSMKKKIKCDFHGNTNATTLGNCEQCLSLEHEKELRSIKQKDLLEKKRRAGILTRYINSNFSNYNAHTTESMGFLNFCKNYAFNKDLLIQGKTGTGKTHMAAAIIENALLHKKSCQYIKFYNLYDIKIKDIELYKKILNCDLLVLDEYGMLDDSNKKSQLLGEVIEMRYSNNVNTIIITNLEIKAFKESIGDSIASRLKENTIIKICEWKDYRVKNENK